MFDFFVFKAVSFLSLLASNIYNCLLIVKIILALVNLIGFGAVKDMFVASFFTVFYRNLFFYMYIFCFNFLWSFQTMALYPLPFYKRKIFTKQEKCGHLLLLNSILTKDTYLVRVFFGGLEGFLVKLLGRY